MYEVLSCLSNFISKMNLYSFRKKTKNNLKKGRYLGKIATSNSKCPRHKIIF